MPIKGLDQLSKKLDQLAKNAKELDGTHSVSLTDVLTPAFVSQHTRFADADQLFEASGFNANSQAEFEAIPEDKLDAFIRSESSFGSWKDMLSAAGAAWAKGRLGL
jgi:hypothetical protein